jgi:hypothetical protein
MHWAWLVIPAVVLAFYWWGYASGRRRGRGDAESEVRIAQREAERLRTIGDERIAVRDRILGDK